MLFKKRAIDKALLKLGENPARTLHKLGITGDTKPTSCPLATYIGAETGIAVSVEAGHIFVYGHIRPITRLSPALQMFIQDFDRGDYPELKKRVSLSEAVCELYWIPSLENYFCKTHITGVRGSATSCPIARYLSMRTGQKISVTSLEAYALGWYSQTRVPLPTNVSDFIRRFDKWTPIQI